MTDKNISPAGAPVSVRRQNEPNLRQCILVVEDDAAIRRVNSEVLICSGYQVDAAEDGAVAWDALQLKNYDLVLTDNDMPNVTGLELIQKIQAARMDLPVIMATGTLPDEKLTRYSALQPALTLLKPYSFDELVEAVKTVLCAFNESHEEIVPPPNWQTSRLNGRLQL
jgi:two-component system chemotaxis response regulator CheY